VSKSTTNAFPLIDVHGSPRQRGQQYGEQAADRVRLGIENYKVAFAKAQVEWPEAREIAGGFIAELARREPDLLEEIEGIAEGAGVDVEEVLALNCRTEILYHRTGKVDVPTDGCTGIIALPVATRCGRVLHAQNWDWRDESAETAVVLRIRYDDGHVLLTQTEAGILARCGLNSAGIALTGNFLKCDRDNSPGGIPIPFVRRRILEKATFNDAIEVVYKSPKSFSTNLMISHAGGHGINFEAVPGETFWIQPDRGLIVHANHFESIAGLARVIDKGIEVTPCTLFRGRRVRDALEPHIGDLTFEHFKEALGDKFDAPFSVCADPDKEPDGTLSSTVATILIDAAEGTMEVAVRPYAAHTYVKYDLDAP